MPTSIRRCRFGHAVAHLLLLTALAAGCDKGTPACDLVFDLAGTPWEGDGVIEGSLLFPEALPRARVVLLGMSEADERGRVETDACYGAAYAQAALTRRDAERHRYCVRNVAAGRYGVHVGADATDDGSIATGDYVGRYGGAEPASVMVDDARVTGVDVELASWPDACVMHGAGRWRRRIP